MGERPFGPPGRTPSHSLLSTSSDTALPSRKSRFADPGTAGGNIGRASVSMPPPATKPSSIYRPANSRLPVTTLNATETKEEGSTIDGAREGQALSDSAAFEELHKTASLPNSQAAAASEPQSPSGLADFGLRPPGPGLGRPGDRLSFSSSLYSLGSAIYNGAAGLSSAPQSAASSNAGSIKSGTSEQPALLPTPLSPPLGVAKGEASSSATTATDPVSVTANSQPEHQGSRAS